MGGESDGKGGSGQRRIQSGESDAPLGAITISDQVRIFTTCQISPRCPQRARNYILQTDWKVVFVARCMRPAGCICLGLSEAYPFHSLLPSRDPRHSAYHFAPRLSVTRTQKRDIRDQCDLPPFHNRPYSFTDTASPIEGVGCQWPLRIIQPRASPSRSISQPNLDNFGFDQ